METNNKKGAKVAIKILPEELEYLQTVDKKIQTLHANLGVIEVEIHKIIQEKNKVLNMISQITVGNSGYMDMLQKKYGSGNIDINTGELIPV